MVERVKIQRRRERDVDVRDLAPLGSFEEWWVDEQDWEGVQRRPDDVQSGDIGLEKTGAEQQVREVQDGSGDGVRQEHRGMRQTLGSRRDRGTCYFCDGQAPFITAGRSTEGKSRYLCAFAAAAWTVIYPWDTLRVRQGFNVKDSWRELNEQSDSDSLGRRKRTTAK